MSPDQPTNPISNPGNDQAMPIPPQPGAVYQPVPEQPPTQPLAAPRPQEQPQVPSLPPQVAVAPMSPSTPMPTDQLTPLVAPAAPTTPTPTAAPIMPPTTPASPPVTPAIPAPPATQAASQQYSNPFASQPFMNQPIPGQPVPTQPGVPPLTPTSDQPIEHVDPANQPNKKTTKRLIIVVIVLLSVLALAAIAYFFLIFIPNQPQNVWKTGLNRSGKVVDTISSKVGDKETLDALKKSEVNATVSATAGSLSYDGSVDVKYDAANATGDIKLSQKGDGEADKVFTAKFMSQLKGTAQLPSVYLQFSGLKSLGLDQFLPALTSYENKWISIDESYLKSMGLTPESVKESKDKQLTSKDVSDGVQAVVTTTSDYLLTANPKKAVFEQRKFVGKQKVDGKTAYHYIVGINKQHAKDYCAAIAGTLVQTEAYKKIVSSSSDQKDSITKDCQKSVDEIKDSDTFDMWIDAKYKLIYKLRFTDEKDKNSYTEIGQNYQGGSAFTIFVKDHNAADKTDVTFALEADLKAHHSKGAITAVSQGDTPYNIKITLEAKPYTGDIKADTPAGAISIEEVLKALGIDPLDLTTDGSRSANDVERMSDIKTLHSQAEAYYATTGRYPSLANLNDAKWLKANMSGLDVSALKDPENSSTAIVATPTAKSYAYQPKAKDGSTCDNVKKDCDSYVLTATLADGKTYAKENLN